MRGRVRAGAIAAALLLTGCGGSSRKSTTKPATATKPGTATTTAPTRSGLPALAELLSVPATGRLYGRCQPGEGRFTVEFIAAPGATDSVTYRVGSARPRTVNLSPGDVLNWRLAPGRYTMREPADPISRSPATTIKTTVPITLTISQGTEPHVFRASMQFTVAAATGGSTNCALIESRLYATTYYPGGQPPS
jgi:hypothetical protein